MKSFITGLALALGLVSAPAAPPVKFVTSIALPGGLLPAFADYLNVDAERHLLYVGFTGRDQVVCVDLQANQVVGSIKDLPHVHALVPLPDGSKGYASVGGKSEVAVIDLKTRTVWKHIPTGQGPDGIIYNPAAGQIYVGNHKGKSATLIDPVKDVAIATIPLGGIAEYAQADPASGLVYQNLEDTSEVVVVDPAKHQVTARYPLAPGEGPSGLALDAPHQRLFAACDNQLLVVLDAASGKRVATVPIGSGVDFAAYDPALARIYTANGESADMSVIQQHDADHYSLLANVKTFDHGHALAVDPSTHRVYVVHGGAIAVYDAVH